VAEDPLAEAESASTPPTDADLAARSILLANSSAGRFEFGVAPGS